MAREMGVPERMIKLPGSRVWDPMMKFEAEFTVMVWPARVRTAGGGVLRV